MAVDLVQESFQQYLYNIKASLAFGLTLVFVLVFGLFPNIYVGTGSIFLEYSLANMDMSTLALEVLAALAFLLFYSLFITVLVFSIRNSLSYLKLNYYLREMIQKFTVKLFTFYVVYFLAIMVIASLLSYANVPLIFISLIVFIVSALFIFVPQSIVIDESGLMAAFYNNLEFIRKNMGYFLLVIIVGMALLAIGTLIEYFFDSFMLLGRFFSLFFTIVFVLPFVEALKSCLYMFKFEIIKGQQMTRR